MGTSRRTLLLTGLAAAASARAGRAAAAPPSSDPAAALPGLDVDTDTGPLTDAADDFGHLVHCEPAAVVEPRTDADVASVIGWAGGIGRRVAAQGQSHSVWGRAQARNGVVLDMHRMRSIGPVRGDRVAVEAGATWSAVLDATLPHGLTPPVLTDYLGLSVGGTLIVGGVGGTSAEHGLQTDNVAELDVVTGRAERLRCSRRRHAEVFDAVRAGLGQVAVITRATLRLVPAPRHVRRFLAFYADLSAMLRDTRLLTAERRFDVVRGALLPTPGGGWTYRLELVAYFTDQPPSDATLLDGLIDNPDRREAGTEPYEVFVRRLDALEEALRTSGQWFLPHPWLTTFVGDSRVEAVLGAELPRLDPARDLGPFGQVVLSPLRADAIASPLLRSPEDRLFFAFNLIRFPTTDDRAEMARLVDDNKGTYRRVRRSGGTLYPVSAFPMSRLAWRRHFGTVLDDLRRIRQRHNPAGLLTPGYDIF